MKAYLLAVGQAAESSLPVVLSALSCGAAGSTDPSGSFTSLDIFHLSDAGQSGVLPAFTWDLSACSGLFPDKSFPFFRCSFSYTFLRPQLPDIRQLYENRASSLLLGALRGSGVPLSYRTDREAAEWGLSLLLNKPEGSGDIVPFTAWLGKIRQSCLSGDDCRLMVLADLSQPASSGFILALLPFLRSFFEKETAVPFIGLIASAPLPASGTESAVKALRDILESILDRKLLRPADTQGTRGADALWLLSLPSSLRDFPSCLVSFVSARIIGRFYSDKGLPSFGLHTLSVPSSLHFGLLGSNAVSFATFLEAAVWCLVDLFPSLRAYLDHQGRLRSLSPSSRNNLFRRLFPKENLHAEDLRLMERTLQSVLSVIVTSLESLPSSLVSSEESGRAWQAAVEACGRYVTVASELDVSAEEARDSGVDQVMPVHRASLADTEEEKVMRKLGDLEDQLSAEGKKRAEALSSIGGYRSWQVLSDCLSKCLSAQEETENKLHSLMQQEDPDHFRLGMQERRVRLLKAAVSRCRVDLKTYSAYPALSAGPSSSGSVEETDSGILTPAVLSLVAALLSQDPVRRLKAEKELPEQLPLMFPGSRLPDLRAHFRSLQELSGQADSPDHPPALIFSFACKVCLNDTESLRFTASSTLPDLPLLPDALVSGPLSTLPDLFAALPEISEQSSSGHLRGLLAMLFLRQYRRTLPEEAVITSELLRSEDSPVLSSFLSGRGAGSLWIVSLKRNESSLPAAIIIPGIVLISAKWTSVYSDLVPSFATWYDSDSASFQDPCTYLGESDRAVLCDQLHLLQASVRESSPLRSFISSFLGDLQSSSGTNKEDLGLSVRLRAACGLPELLSYSSLVHRVQSYYERALPDDRIAAMLSGREHFRASACSYPDEILYTYRGFPFARESSSAMLESLRIPEEEHILSVLEKECSILHQSSDDYRDALTRSLSRLIRQYPDACPASLELAEKLLTEAEKPMRESITDLSWPWDPASPAVRTILEECLGPGLASAAAAPFSDLLTVFPARSGDLIGDTLLAQLCTVPSSPNSDPESDETQPAGDTLLPPLSPDFSRVLCLLPEGKTLVQSSFLRFERCGDRAWRVIFTLEGSFTLRLSRKYQEDEILSLYSHQMPTVAVWPSVPFAAEDWHAYYVYAHLPEELKLSVVYSDDVPLSPLSGDLPRRVSSLPSFPVCFVFFRADQSIGALPNLLPAPEILKTGAMLASVDFGSSSSSIVLSGRDHRFPLQNRTLLRTILSHPSAGQELLRREFLPALPLTSLLPSAVRIFRNQAGAAPAPFQDGIISFPSGFADLIGCDPASLYSFFKWEEKGRAAHLFLHQLMLTAALEARFSGAESLFWRFALPDEMAVDGRDRLMALFRQLAFAVSLESGLKPPEKQPPVSFASESSSLGAYFRFCAAEDTRGGFMVLDLGSDTADISLFLRGRELAERSCQLPLGLHYMLLPSLLRAPALLTSDYSFVQDENLAGSLLQLQELLTRASSDPAALRLTRSALDAFLAEHLPQLVSAAGQRMADGRPALSAALLLLHFSYLMMLTGLLLLQIASDPQKNDFLPEQLAVCFAGRGSSLLECLDPNVKNALWSFLTMFRNRRVASLSFLFSSEKKMEIPVGLSLLQDVYESAPPSASVPSSLAVRPDELLPEFLLRFFQLFPQEASLLFPGFISGNFARPFSQRAQALISASLQASFREETVVRPYNALSSWIGNLLELVHTGG